MDSTLKILLTAIIGTGITYLVASLLSILTSDDKKKQLKKCLVNPHEAGPIIWFSSVCFVSWVICLLMYLIYHML